MSKYDATIKRAKSLITRKGANGVVWQKATPVPDTLPQYPVTPDPTEYLVDMAFYPIERANLATLTVDLQTDLTKTTYVGAMAGGLDFTPQVGDIVVFPDASKHQVLYMQITAPDTIPVLYECYMT